MLSLSFSSRGDLLATAARDAKARVFRVPSEGSEPLFLPVKHSIGEDTYSHRGPDRIVPRFAEGDRVLLTVAPSPEGAEALLWYSAVTGDLLFWNNSPDGNSLHAFAVSPKGHEVAAIWGSKGRLWDAETREVLLAIPTPPRFAWNEDVIFSADGSTLVTCGHDTKARFWSVKDRSVDMFAETFPSVYHPMQAVRVNLSPDGRHLATALWDGTVYLWRCPVGAPTTDLAAEGGPTLPLLSPDKRFVLPRGLTFRTGSRLETRVYDAQTGRPLATRSLPEASCSTRHSAPMARTWPRPALAHERPPSATHGFFYPTARGVMSRSGTGRADGGSQARSRHQASRVGWPGGPAAPFWLWFALTIA